MQWMELVVAFLQATAWPVVEIVFLLFLRKPSGCTHTESTGNAVRGMARREQYWHGPGIPSRPRVAALSSADGDEKLSGG